MSGWKQRFQGEMSLKAVIGIIMLLVVGVGYFGWKTVSAGEPDAGPRKKVYPGMYDIRAEAAKRQAESKQGALSDAP